MVRLTTLFILIVLVFNLSGCQEQEAQEAKASIKEESSTERVEPIIAPIAKLPCKKSMSPPIKDKTKIKNMLEKSGRITPEMSPQQVEKVVNDYISNKKAAFKDCLKKG